jgi:hypothetical protein
MRVRPEHDHVMFRKVNLNSASDPFSFSRTTTTSPSPHLGLLGSPLSLPVMWAKFTNVLKHRPTVDESEASSPDVGSTVHEKQPNVLVPHNDDDSENKPAEVPFPAPSPPGSPSRHRNGVFRRKSRSVKHDSGEPSKTSSALKLPLRLPKKVKSHVSIHTNGRCIPAWALFVAHRAITTTSVSSLCQHCSRFYNAFADRRHTIIDG